MPDNAAISQVIEEVLESGRTPEDLCAGDTALLNEVRRRLRKLRRVEAQLEDLFPSSAAATSQAERARQQNLSGKLPDIPGYEVDSILGHGGMGVVYKATHLKLNRLVAIKMLLSGLYASAAERTRFLREAEAVARLSHPNVVQVHDMGECDGFPYFTMEFVEGGNLAQNLTGTPWPANQAAVLIGTLASAVHFAHQAGIVHRDLKPGNILLTSDGTPKISDFGLARRVDDDVTVTISGVRVGTPSYMAPEQALGKTKNVGPAADIYALGAILYELLTGRPPFRAETTSETQRQLILQDPVPPSRLNSKVPRDLETICLMCLRKEPDRRYATSAALAEDFQRFIRREPIAARRTGLIERSAKWTRRHPATTVAMIGCLVLLVVLISGGFWWALQRSDVAAAVNGDLAAVADLQRQERWSEARATLGRAQAILAAGGTAELHQRCTQVGKDLDLAVALDDIRITRMTSGLLIVYRQMANEKYADLFSQAQLGTFRDRPELVAKRVNASAEHKELMAALDDWAYCSNDPDQREWILNVALAADPDPGGWDRRILNPVDWANPRALKELANTVPVDKVPLPLLLALAERLIATNNVAIPYLVRVQKEYPDDFWANLVIGNAMLIPSPGEARGYYRVALARRPEAPVGYCAIGDTLREQSAYNEAIEYYRKAIQLDPNYARGYSNIGLAFQKEGKYTDAINYYDISLRLDPKYAWSYFNLGDTLAAQNKPDQAEAAYQKAIDLEPNNAYILDAIRSHMMGRRRSPEDIWADWHEMILTNPPKFEYWWGYPELTLFLGKQDEYRSARTQILKQFGDTLDPMFTEKIGRACLLMPGSDQEIRTAADLIDRSVAAKDSVDAWVYPYFVFAKGLAEYRLGHYENAAAIMQTTSPDGLVPAPQLVFAMSLYHQGKQDAARKALAAAVIASDWRPARATKRDLWMTHILCREAVATILPNYPAFLAGKYQPRDNNERLGLVAACEFDSRHATEAQLLADAFAADPALADDIQNGLRQRAACAAALAVAGRGKDSLNNDNATRAHWCDQARLWLLADLKILNDELKHNLQENGDLVSRTLGGWKSNKDLAAIRDSAALKKLSPDQRNQCIDLWNQIENTLTQSGS